MNIQKMSEVSPFSFMGIFFQDFSVALRKKSLTNQLPVSTAHLLPEHLLATEYSMFKIITYKFNNPCKANRKVSGLPYRKKNDIPSYTHM